MKRPLLLVLLLCCVWMMGCGGTYHYYTDPSAKLESTRYEYVKYNPGAAHNNQILAGNIKSGMNPEEIRAAWGLPSAIAPGEAPGIEEVWAYHDPDQSHGNTVWMLSFSQGSLKNVEKLVGMMMAAGAKGAGQTHAGESDQSAQSDKPR